MKDINVAILGASNKPDRYSYQALFLLRKMKYPVIPVHPRLKEIDGIPVLASLDDIGEEVHTLTIYVGPARVEPLIESIVRLNPKRVILNPGTESKALMRRLDEAGIPYLEACTLVMLHSRQF